MKKLFFIPCIIGASLLASCSSESELADNGASDALTSTQWSHQIANSNVEIKFGSKIKGTRAIVESDDQQNFTLTNMGLFCLAIAKNNINPNEANIDYTQGSAGYKYSVWVDNAEVKTEKDAGNNKTILTWADGKKHYYPTGNWHKYAFYGYYPKQDAANIIYDKKSVSVMFEDLDGTTDIIYGKAEDLNTPYAYSAYYFRQEGNEDKVPTVAFAHKLMRLTFAIKPGGKDKEAAKTMGVTKVEVVKVPTKGTLTLADKDAPANAGYINFDWNTTADLALHAKTDATGTGEGLEPEFTAYDATNETKACWVKDNEVNIGQGIMIPVPDYETNPDYKYQLKITLINKDGQVFEPEYPMDLNTNGNEFAAGTSYKVTMTINGPKEIQLNATLEKWKEDNTTIGGIIL